MFWYGISYSKSVEICGICMFVGKIFVFVWIRIDSRNKGWNKN